MPGCTQSRNSMWRVSDRRRLRQCLGLTTGLLKPPTQFSPLELHVLQKANDAGRNVRRRAKRTGKNGVTNLANITRSVRSDWQESVRQQRLMRTTADGKRSVSEFGMNKNSYKER